MKYNNYMRKTAFFATITVFSGCFALIFAILLFPLKYMDEITVYSEKYGHERELILAVIKTESGFDGEKISEKGATGLMQVMPNTAEYVSKEFFDGKKFDLLLPKDNIEIGCFYLSYLREKFGGETETLAAYNAGEGNVKMWLSEHDGRLSADDIPFPETKKYVRRVKTYAKIYRFILNFKGVILSRFIMQ